MGAPLWSQDLDAVRGLIHRIAPSWASMPLCRHATYLGIDIGPEKVHHQWDRPAKHFKEKVSRWEWAQLGLYFSCTAYNIFALSTLGFVAQVAQPDSKICALEMGSAQSGTMARQSDDTRNIFGASIFTTSSLRRSALWP